ncbi:MAG TPA: cation/multidrug efflux pump [Gammaproteobacteria bacterium]
MNALVAIAAAAGIAALFFLSRTVACTRHGRLVRAGGAGVGTLASGAIAVAAVLVAISYYSYERLTAEQVVATVAFRQTARDVYQARLMVDGEHDRTFELRGNEWQMDARLVTWKPPVTILGLEPIYRLERLSGRYTDIGREQSESRTVYSLAEPLAVDVWAVARRFPLLTPGIDAHYGSATYAPMADGARFEVSLSRDAVIARPANAAASAALGRWSEGD